MKKIIFIMFMIIMVHSSAQSDVITFDNLASFGDLTTDIYNNTLNKLYSKINTGIGGDNIVNQTITSEDIATAVNPLVRDQENVGEYVFTGLTLPSSGAATSGTMTAGTAYITKDDDATLHRVVTATSSAITNFSGYTANQDNWVYLDFAGSFAIQAVGIGASQPADLSNSIVLGQVEVDSGGTIQSADETARQTTPPSLRIYQDSLMGLYISRDITDVDIVTVGRGEIELGSTGGKRRNTSSINIDFDVSGLGGLAAADTYTANTFYYLYTFPNTGNASNYSGIAGSATTGVADVADERLVGWCYSDSSMNISADSVGGYKALGSSQPNIVHISRATDIATTSNTYVAMITGKFYSSGRPIFMMFTAPVNTTSTNGAFFAFSVDGVTHGETSLDDTDNAQRQIATTTAIAKVGAGEHTINAIWHTTGAVSITQVGATEGARRLTIMEL